MLAVFGKIIFGIVFFLILNIIGEVYDQAKVDPEFQRAIKGIKRKSKEKAKKMYADWKKKPEDTNVK